MEFDEYEYLEKTVEPSAPSANGSGEKDRGGSRRRSSGRDDEERGSKRSRSGEDRDRDRDRERHRGGGREHRDRDDAKEKDKEKKEKEKEKDKERERSSRGRDKDGEKDRGREREGRDKDSERDRRRERDSGRERRSRSRSERRRTEEEEMVRELQRERERSDRNRDYRDRDVRRRKDDGAEPEADPERDQRTVFAFQLSLKADERDVYEFFSRAGKVRDVRLIMDRNSRRSKGVGYIEFYDAMSVPMAIALTGQMLLGQQVMVKPSEAEKNLVQSNVTSGGVASGGARKLYVGNLHANITEDQLRQVFEPFGQVELVQLPVDPLTGLCKGFGFIQFARLEDAKAAQSLNGQLDIAGRVIKVSAVTEQAGMQVGGATTGDLDDDEGGGLALNASSRALLMRKLDRSGTATSLNGGIGGVNTSVELPAPLATTSLIQPAIPAIGTVPGMHLPATTQSADIGPPTEFLLLKNMFDPALETDPDFDLDIKDDVQDECSKFGAVNHIFVDKNTAGFVYLHFDSVAAATNAQRALHGRWFAGKMITATFMTAQQYKMKFPN
ncbi:RNA-binding protein 39-like [Oryza brachyantha]|uniref:RNA-binding protein 39-like n=1 Tax=Oryza brachyantha TaxID=4533 RepID=UPI001ADBA6E5|nr:RNA-binding protein 39-like [Oryza brachyantha]